MNILYISMLNGKKSAGVSYSIPAQINSQSQFDNVFWYNINHIPKSKIINGEKCYNLEDYPSLEISKLPSPFNKPDLVIFEGVYFYKYIKLSKECKKNGLPYIIIPRSSLTKNAQKKKAIKKIIGNLLFFNSFIKGARAIQYLTYKEYIESGDKWNERYIIIPNGIEPKKKTKTYSQSQEIRGTFIGRADSYQKGIDLLLDACMLLKDELIKHNCKIDIFAPNSREDKDNIQEMISIRELDGIVFKHDGVYGIEKEEVLLNSDFFVLTSRFEGHPMGLIEALSYGLPCLVTEGTNMGDEIRQEDAGWVADCSVESIADALMKMLNDRNKFCIKSQNALKLSKKYNWSEIAKNSHIEYKKLLN